MDKTPDFPPAWKAAATTALVAAFPIVAAFGHKGVVVLASGLAVVGLANGGWRSRLGFRGPRAVGLCLAAFFGWAGISLLWTIEPGEGLSKFLQIPVVFLLGGAAVGAIRDDAAANGLRLWRWFSAGLAVALAGLAYMAVIRGPLASVFYPEIWNTGSMFNMKQFSPGLIVISAIIWPVFLGLRRELPQARWPWLLFAATGYEALTFGSHTAAVVFCVSGAAQLVTWWWGPRAFGNALAVLLATAMLLAPLAVRLSPTPIQLGEYMLAPGNVQHRLLIWHFALDRILEKPTAGWGFNASRSIPGADDEGRIVSDNRPRPMITYEQKNMPLHPHNVPLQIWLELGAVGAVLAAALVAALAVAAGRSGGMLVSLLPALAAVGMIGVGAWQTWWLSILWIMVAITSTAGGKDGE